MQNRKYKVAPVQPVFKNRIVYNNNTGFYDISQEEITYHLTMAQMTALKEFLYRKKDIDVKDWYNQLPRTEKKYINKTAGDEAAQQYNDGDFIE